jgi:hypothetical protein
MEDTVEFRQRLISLCQARPSAARQLLSEHPDLLSDLSEQHLSALVEAAGEDDDWRSQTTFRAALSLIRRARQIGVDVAIDEAERAETGKVPEELTELPVRAAEAGARYEATGSIDDLDEEIAAWNAVLDHPLVDRVHRGYRWAALSDSAAAHFTRWDHSGQLRDLDDAIERWRQICAEMAPKADAAAAIHNNLAVAVLTRYGATGSPDDLTLAVESAETALAEARDDDKLLPKFNADLAAALHERHLATGAMADLEQAIVLYEAALDDMAAGTGVYASTLNNLATALNDRFERTADPADRARARQLLEHSVDSTGEASVQRSRHLANLAGHMATPAEALAARSRLLDAPSASPAVRAGDLNNLASSLIEQFLDTLDPSALDDAIDLLEEALDLVEPATPDFALYSLNCGNARRLRFIAALDVDEQLQQLLRGMEVLDAAISSGLEVNPQVALRAARHAGDWYSEIENWDQAVEVYGLGLRAADSLLRVQLGRRDKETWLRSIADMPSQAAYANAQAGDPRAAALAMEHGHAILLAEALDLKRADIDRLQAEGRVELGERFKVLAARWNQLSSA